MTHAVCERFLNVQMSEPWTTGNSLFENAKFLPPKKKISLAIMLDSTVYTPTLQHNEYSNQRHLLDLEAVATIWSVLRKFCILQSIV